MAALCGVLVAVGALTRYSFGWLILPLTGFFALYFGQRRILLCLLAVVAFTLTLAPWLGRNYHYSGTLFGTAGYAVAMDTTHYPADRLERTLKPDLSGVPLREYRWKFLANLNTIFQEDLPKFGGSWLSAFFLVGLFVPFVSPGLQRLRVFLVLCLLALCLAQALGRTHLSTDSPDVNSENLLVLLAPLVFIYGAGMFLPLLDQVDLPFPQLRHALSGLFVVFACNALIFALLPPRRYALAYPPYYPPQIQKFTAWMQDKELIMSDMPWAVAWYGRRQCVWTTLKVEDPKDHNDFYAINDLQKQVRGLYLTLLSTDGKFFSQMVHGEDWAWGRFVMDSTLRTNLPPGFPLKHAPTGYLEVGQLFLTDWPRWTIRSVSSP
jgi:hypothetical protein